ncbi:hypothetical protein NESM_000138200 [Novymonas esmeraldas]|uniref:Non-specific serine/threonine protein kinase n=1 Tax=Novymonas esmeraldas TaxID=1808958 RepID=A0AAW0F3P7_9TRYP
MFGATGTSVAPSAAGGARLGFGFSAAPSTAGAATTLPAASPPAPVSSSAAPPPPAAAGAGAGAASASPPTSLGYEALFAKACRDGEVSDAFVHEIKKRFSAPMEVTVAAPPPATGSSPAAAAQGFMAASPAAAPWQSAVATAAAVPHAALAGLSAAGTAATSILARASGPQPEQERRRLQVEQALMLLQTLERCDSGYRTGGDDTDLSQQARSCDVDGLHAAVAAVAVSAASNLVAYLKASVTAHNQASDGDGAVSNLFGDSRHQRPDRNPLLLAAQCLYLLSQQFQLSASVVKEALGLVDAMYLLVKNLLQGRVVSLAALSDNADTCCLNTLLWLITFSIVNMVAVWKRLRSATGELQPNDLIQSNVASSIEATVSGLRRQLRDSVQPQSVSGGGGGGLYGDALTDTRRGGGGGGGGGRASQAPAPVLVYSWQVLLDSYLSILTLAEGTLLRAKGSDSGYDKALDAFLGARAAQSTSSASHAGSGGGGGPASGAAVHRGKVTKRMVELAPVPRTLVISLGRLYMVPYEIMSYLFDEMLPLLHHLSELEVATHRRYCEQLEELPRLPSFVRGSGAAPTAADAFNELQPRSRAVESGGGDAWWHKTSHAGTQGAVVGEPFTSEMAHLLEALAKCLQHLPPEVLDSDLEADCAATFFIFENFVRHMRQVFATQRSIDTAAAGTGAVWKNYTLKLMTRFMEVLSIIGRHPQYTQRVVVLLTNAQTACGELQWNNLVRQALECAGFNSAAMNVPGVGGGHGGAAPPPALATVAAAAPGSADNSEDMYALLAATPGTAGVPRVLHRQFTRAYARKCQRHYISGFFLLLRQLYAHPTLRSMVSSYMNLTLALTFLSAPQQSQLMLGSTLSLISALVTNAADAQLVWSFLDQRRLLQHSSVRTTATTTQQQQQQQQEQQQQQAYGRYSSAGPREAAVVVVREEALSLIGHCQYECTQGTYDITIGFLNLAAALFQHDQPTTAAMPVYRTVTHFIAQDILRGVLKRMFARAHERYTVVALAAAAVRQALLVRFRSSENGRTAVLPFGTIMAMDKAPADVVGEVLQVILNASDTSVELLGHHRVAVHQAMRLLITAVQVVREQKVEQLLFDNRTMLSTDLAVRVLGLCSPLDTLRTRTTLQLLLLFPLETANQAAHYWSGLTAKYASVLDSFADLLHPLNTVPAVVQAPPELAQLDLEPSELVPRWPTALLSETKSLLLDLLMQHADVTEPSLTAWMCGFYGEELARRDRRGQSLSGLVGTSSADDHAVANAKPGWWQYTLLTSVVAGACDSQLEKMHPALAVKYVKLLYLLRANRLYGSPVIRPFLGSVCQMLFLRLQHFSASGCTPVALSKYAYVLKLLALEACYAYRTAPRSLRLAQNTTITSIAVEVLLSLLHPYTVGVTADGDGVWGREAGEAREADPRVAARPRRTRGEGTTAGEQQDEEEEEPWGDDVAIMSRDAAVDITSWLPQALRVLPTFPEKLPVVTGGLSHLLPSAADGVVQYSMTSLYGAMQAEQARAKKPPLTMEELRERLRPFIAANDCFFSYAAGVSFVEGWCQLVSVCCSVVQGLSVSRLRSFALCILHGLDATTRLTTAAQEQVAVRLCCCLSTVMAHLRQTVCTSVALSLAAPVAAAVDAPPSTTSAAAPSSYQRGGQESHAVPSWAGEVDTAPIVPSSRRLRGDGGDAVIGQRRPRDEGRRCTVAAAAAQDHRHGRSFSSRAGDVSEFFGAASRARLAQAVLQRSGSGTDRRLDAGERGGASLGLPNMAIEDGAATLLEPVVRALVRWGTRIAPVRAELYLCLLCLAETPGVSLDDVAVWRFQRGLLDVVCADICGDGGLHARPAASAAGSGMAQAQQQQQQAAAALLVALLQTSAPIRDEFCRPDSGSGSELGTSALRCATALLNSADVAVCGFFASNGAQLGHLLWHLRTAFDVVSVVSLSHGSEVLHSDLLRACFSMRAWQYAAQVVLGYSHAEPSLDHSPGRTLAEQNKEVVRRLLLGVVRWWNLLLSSLGDAKPLLYLVQSFIRDNRQLVDYVFLAPAAVSTAGGGAARLSASHLTLCAELSDCLRALSSSVLAVDCRSLAEGMALAELLGMLSSDAVWQHGPTELYDFSHADGEDGGAAATTTTTTAAAAAARGGAAAATAAPAAAGSAIMDTNDTNAREGGGGAAAAHGTSAAERGRDVVALTVRNLAHLLLNAEYGQRRCEDASVFVDHADATPMLRHSAGKQQLIARIVRNIAHSLTRAGGAEVRELRLECSLYALHAVVCLLHSFVLPLGGATRQGSHTAAATTAAAAAAAVSVTPTGLHGAFARYLAELPLGEFVDALTRAQEAVNQLREFNTDYRGGMGVSLHTSSGWVIAASPQTLSNGVRAGAAEPGVARLTASPPGATHAAAAGAAAAAGRSWHGGSSSSEAFSVPSTPGVLPASYSRGGARDGAAGPQSPDAAALASTTAGRHSAQAGGPQPSATESHSGVHCRDPNMTVAVDLDRAYPSTSPVPGARDTGARAGATVAGGYRPSSLLPATDDAVPVKGDVTLRDLLPPQELHDSAWTRLYDSAAAHDPSGAARDGDLDATGLRGAPLQWRDVLDAENEVRQVKIAIANALRATRGAMGIVQSRV